MSGTNGLSASGVPAQVAEKFLVAEGLVTLTLTDPDGARLPDWNPGSDFDPVLPDGTTRQYSLCGDRWDAYSYRVGVLREPAGRGKSAYVHDELTVGALVGITRAAQRAGCRALRLRHPSRTVAGAAA